jgi:methyl-accepting chemotaxis protein
VRDSSDEVSTAIRDLAEKSEQIGQIVETITGIAEQTNLLALNAAIEAARAGEQGRGFAVVAEEVRKLAEEAQSAAQEISQLIGAIQGQTHRAVEIVEDGVRRTQDGAAVVEQTREAFQKIDASVENMTARVEQIAAVSQQIAAGADSMQSHIAEVAAVAQQSSASTEEVSAVRCLAISCFPADDSRTETVLRLPADTLNDALPSGVTRPAAIRPMRASAVSRTPPPAAFWRSSLPMHWMLPAHRSATLAARV